MTSIRCLYDRIKKLKSFEIFESLPEEVFWQLADNVSQIIMKKNQNILKPFSKNEVAYFIIKGQVEVEIPEDISASKSSIKPPSSLNAPINIKSYPGSPIIKILKSGDYLGFDSSSIKKVSDKPYLSSCFAECLTQCTMLTIQIKVLSTYFSPSSQLPLSQLLNFHSPNPFLKDITNISTFQQHILSFYKPSKTNTSNTPISRQHTQTSLISKHPRNRSCLSNYEKPTESKTHCRITSKDKMQQNVTYFIHNLIVKKIRKNNERQNEKNNQFKKIIQKRIG